MWLWLRTSPSSHSVCTVLTVWSASGWTEQASVHNAAQPPSAFTSRCAALAPGLRHPAPVHCGTWISRFFNVFGPMRTGSNRGR
jgi:hypothetical protein